MTTLPQDFGQCFDTAALAVVQFPTGAILCHGLGIANLPEQKGRRIAHAWVEYNGEAYDTTWMVHQNRLIYRENLKLSYCVEYSQDKVWENWRRTDHPGPWDKQIIEHLMKHCKCDIDP